MGLLPALAPTSAQAVAKCTAADFGCAPTGTCVITETHDIGPGCHLDWGTQNVEIRGTLRSESLGDSYSITGGQILLDGGKVRSTGNNVEPAGDITISASGRFWMTGPGSRVETDANAGGGSVIITANDVLIVGGGAIDTDGGQLAGCGSAGDVTMSASGGPVVLAGSATTISASTGGYDCDGGFVVIDGPSLSIQKSINAAGGGPPGITLVASDGNIALSAGALLDARGRGADEDFGNNGGDLDLFAPSGSINLQGALNANGSGGDGSGGDIQLDASGGVVIADSVGVAGVGTFSSGGVLEISALGNLTIGANVDVSGGPQGDGGTIDAVVGGSMVVSPGTMLSALGGAFGGGFIDLRAVSNATIDGDIIGRGGSTGNGGFIDIRGCHVSVSSTIDVEPGAVGSAGLIDLTGGAITLTSTARLEALPCLSGLCNTLTLGSGVPSIDPSAAIAPAVNLVLDPSLAPCCGNGVLDNGLSGSVDAGEECDDGNGSYCDGCTGVCTIEAIPACPDDGNDCTRDCSPGTGCNFAPLTGTVCADEPGGNVCTSDVCSAGVCTHPVNGCDDGIDCTLDQCDALLGCQTTDLDALCDDGEECTSEVCDPTVGDPQTGCATTQVSDGTACDDESVCTSEDECQGGACVPQGPPLQCDDGDECTRNDCDAQLGCLNSEDAATCDCLDGVGGALPSGTSCVDGNNCSFGDSCDDAGICMGGEICPEDGDPCTLEVCAIGMCGHFDNQCPGSGSCVDGQPCSDGTACTLGICNAGQCDATPKPCSDGDECTGIEDCNPVFGCRQIVQPPIGDPVCDGYVTDAFACYRARRSSGTLPFVPVIGVTVEDRLWTRDVDVTRPAAICLPASVAGADPDAVAHDDWLLGYRVRPSAGTPTFVKQTNIEVVNALGTIWVDAKKPDLGFAPTAGDLVSTPALPTPPDPDYFSCYKVGKSRGAPKFLAVKGVTVEDGLGTLTVDVKKPTRLCNPASVNGLTPGAASHPQHLLCYKVRVSATTPPFGRVRGIQTANTIGTGQLDAVKISEICLPSSVVAVGP